MILSGGGITNYEAARLTITYAKLVYENREKIKALHEQFYEDCKAHPEYRWEADKKIGRIFERKLFFDAGSKVDGGTVFEKRYEDFGQSIDSMMRIIEDMKNVLFESYKYAKSKGDQELLLFFITAFADTGCFNARRERIERYYTRKVLGDTSNTTKNALLGIYHYDFRFIDEANALEKGPLTQYLKEVALGKDYKDWHGGNEITKQITEPDIDDYVDTVIQIENFKPD